MRSGTIPLIMLAGTAACAMSALGAPPTLDVPDRCAVTGLEAARRFWHLASSRRVDMCLIGDSNSRLGAAMSGHENAMGRAFAARFGMYATRVDGVGADGFTSQGESGYQCGPFTGYGSNGDADRMTFPVWPFPHGYAALGAEVSIDAYYNCGIYLYPDCPIGIAGRLRFHMTLLDGPAYAGGFFNLSAREAWPGDRTHTYAALEQVNLGGVAGLLDVSLDVPAGDRNGAGVNFCLVNAAAPRGATGPFVATWQRVENPERGIGIAYSPLWELGGRSARDTLQTLQAASVPAPMLEWYRQVTRLQNGPPALLVHIMHGGNDAGDYRGSLGPIGRLDSSTGPGHEDNIRGIIGLLRGWWIQAGHDPDNLFFLLGPYHPRPEAEQQIAFEEAWRRIAASDHQVFTVAGNMLSSVQEFQDRGYRINPVDAYHLSAAGYTAWAAATVRVLDAAVCPADVNLDHAVTVPDIFDFLAEWFAQDARADFNGSGTLTVQDIFDFLAAWFTGC